MVHEHTASSEELASINSFSERLLQADATSIVTLGPSIDSSTTGASGIIFSDGVAYGGVLEGTNLSIASCEEEHHEITTEFSPPALSSEEHVTSVPVPGFSPKLPLPTNSSRATNPESNSLPPLNAISLNMSALVSGIDHKEQQNELGSTSELVFQNNGESSLGCEDIQAKDLTKPPIGKDEIMDPPALANLISPSSREERKRNVEPISDVRSVVGSDGILPRISQASEHEACGASSARGDGFVDKSRLVDESSYELKAEEGKEHVERVAGNAGQEENVEGHRPSVSFAPSHELRFWGTSLNNLDDLPYFHPRCTLTRAEAALTVSSCITLVYSFSEL